MLSKSLVVLGATVAAADFSQTEQYNVDIGFLRALKVGSFKLADIQKCNPGYVPKETKSGSAYEAYGVHSPDEWGSAMYEAWREADLMKSHNCLPSPNWTLFNSLMNPLMWIFQPQDLKTIL